MKLCKIDPKRSLEGRPSRFILIFCGVLFNAFYLSTLYIPHRSQVIQDLTEESGDLESRSLTQSHSSLKSKMLARSRLGTKIWHIMRRKTLLTQRVKSYPNQLRNLDLRTNNRTEMVSRWGLSTDKVPFYNCFLPKAASSSMGLYCSLQPV